MSKLRAIVRCSRCRRVMRRMVGWNAVIEAGVVVGTLCPKCQTPEQNAKGAA